VSEAVPRAFHEQDSTATRVSTIDRGLRQIWQRAVDRRSTLPGEHALAAELGVSRPQIREHLVRLEHEGLIRRRRGADTVVNAAAGDIDVRFDLQIDYAQMLRDRGHEVRVEVLAASRRALSEDEAAFFGVPDDWVALSITKRWRADGEVLIVAEDLLAAPSTVQLDQLELGEEIAALTQQLRGSPIEWTIAVPGAVALNHAECEQLEQPPSSVALSLEVIGVGRDGSRAFRARELHLPGRVRFGFIRRRPLEG
jgi:GntR family transcriptional regulator